VGRTPGYQPFRNYDSGRRSEFLDHFIRQINEPDGERVGLPTIFFPMNRLERISLDEASGSIPSMNELFARKVGRSPF